MEGAAGNDFEVSRITGVPSTADADPSSPPADTKVIKPLDREELAAMWESEPLMAVMCEANGISESQFLNKSDRVEKIEMFLMNFPRMNPLAAFPALTQLFIINQELTEIKGLFNAPLLKEVWLTENRIEKIEGLENCDEIVRLHLSSNRIKKIEGISHMRKIEQLWLCNNQIRRVEGLENLILLRELNMSRNQIELISDSLTSNTNLEDLNLSDNLIGGFKDILNLGTLTKLTKLTLQDAHWGSNPICALCNYQTYLLCHVQYLQSLDNNVVTAAAHATAEATFIKKKMYYNMRIKTLKRSSSTVIKRAMEIRTQKVGQINLNINFLLRHQKDIEREVEEHKHGVEGAGERTSIDEVAKANGVDQDGYLLVLRKKQDKVVDAMESKEKQVAQIDQHFELTRKAITDLTHESISRLILELETGGNIRLEDGRITDPWYTSCVDLMHSRFFSKDFEHCNVGGIRMHRVTRIHNRFLRNRFEERVEEFCASNGDDKDSGRRALEYLFAGEYEELESELRRVTEYGFRHVKDLAELGLGDSVMLSNSLSYIEPASAVKIKTEWAGETYDAKYQDAAGANKADRCVLVTKVLLGKNTPEIIKKPKRTYPIGRASPLSLPLRSSSTLSPTPDGRASGVTSPTSPAPPGRMSSMSCRSPTPAAEPLPIVDEKKMLGAHSEGDWNSVHRSKADDPKQKQWFIFDSAMILPEYLVEYENVSIEEAALFPNGTPDTQVMEEAGITEEVLQGMGPLRRPFQKFVKKCSALVPKDSNNDPAMAVVSSAPSVATRSKIFSISEDVLVQYHKGLVSNLVYLNLHGNSIRKMEHLDGCCNLRTLVLSFNEIHKIEGLDSLRCLERLEMGFNFIKRIEGLQNLANLKVLELNNNLIYRLEDVNVFRKHNSHLTELNLANNAISEMKSYRILVLHRLESVQILDGKPLSQEERRAAAATSSTITDELLWECSHFVRRSQWSGVARLQQQQAARPNTAQAMEDDSWMSQVEELDMDHRRLRKIANLQRMTNLRRASFCDNELTRIEGLDNCTLLEELLLEENRIVKIERMSAFTNLRKLDLGRNKLTRAEGLEGLTMLTELSLEDNEISELQGLSLLPSLMELYLCNNKVSQLSEVLWLKDLPKLIILDMFGNQCFHHPEYRLYAVFYLQKLKVLDGVPVDAAEQQKAREKYAGRVTDEWLEEHLGHKDFQVVTKLELPSAFIRECNCLCDGRFEVLHQLNLDSNQIWDLRMFANLPQLVILKLNQNKIGTPPSKTCDGEEASLTGFKPGALPALEVLYLEGNHISNLAVLQLWHLENLRALYLANNEIQKVEGLNHLTHLREINLNRNRIKTVDEEAFVGMMNIRELYMEENGLKSLSHFGHLTFLHTLHLTSNRLADFNEIDKIAGIRTLLDISITNNPIARKAFYRISIIKRIQSLQLIDGKGIAWDERERAEASSMDRQHPHPAVRVADVARSMYPSIVQDPRRMPAHPQQGNHRVPVKVTSVTFECIGGVRSDDPVMLAVGNKNQPQAGDLPMSREQQQVVVAMGQHPHASDYNHNAPREEFFLPTVGGSTRSAVGKQATHHNDSSGTVRTRSDSKIGAAGRPRSTTLQPADGRHDRAAGSAGSAGAAGGGPRGFTKMYTQPEMHKGGRVALNRPGQRSTPRSQGRNMFGI